MLSSARVSEVLPEIMWNFSHYDKKERRVSLAHNPHLYAELPPSHDAYQPTFNLAQVQNLPNAYHCSGGDNQDSGDNSEHGRPLTTVHLLINKSGRVFFARELVKKVEPQAFDKVWVKDTLLFKGWVLSYVYISAITDMHVCRRSRRTHGRELRVL
jgi:hypothetical protein